MPISSGQFSVGTAATEICSPDVQGLKVWVHNDDRSAGHDIYLGNGDVTTSTGMRMSGGETIMITLDPGDSLHAVSGESNSHDVHVLIQRQD